MKALARIYPGFHPRRFAVPRKPNRVGQWQTGIETMSGQAQWKLQLTLAHYPSTAFATVKLLPIAMTAMSILTMALIITCLADTSIHPRNTGLARQHRPSELCLLVISNQ